MLYIFFCMKLFAIKFSLRIFVFYFKYCNNIANNTRESKNLCEKCIFVFYCKTNKYIPYADNLENDYIIYIYNTTIYNLYLYYTLAILYTGKRKCKAPEGERSDTHNTTHDGCQYGTISCLVLHSRGDNQ